MNEGRNGIEFEPVSRQNWRDGFLYGRKIISCAIYGMISSFVVIATTFGAQLDSKIFIVVGIAFLVATGLYVGITEFFTQKNKIWVVTALEQQIRWDKHYNEVGLKEQIIDLYKEREMGEGDALQVADILFRYDNLLISNVTALETERLPSNSYKNSCSIGAVAIISYLFFGAFPLGIYLIYWGTSWTRDRNYNFGLACIICGVVLFILGCLKALVSSEHWLRFGITSLLNGIIASGVAGLLAWGIKVALAYSI